MLCKYEICQTFICNGPTIRERGIWDVRSGNLEERLIKVSWSPCARTGKSLSYISLVGHWSFCSVIRSFVLKMLGWRVLLALSLYRHGYCYMQRTSFISRPVSLPLHDDMLAKTTIHSLDTCHELETFILTTTQCWWVTHGFCIAQIALLCGGAINQSFNQLKIHLTTFLSSLFSLLFLIFVNCLCGAFGILDIIIVHYYCYYYYTQNSYN